MGRIRNVLITDPVNSVCIQILKDNNIDVTYKPKLPLADILQEIPEYDGLIVRSGTKVTSQVLEAATKMKIVGRAGTGVDNIDCDAATRRGIIVMNTPGGNTMSATEHTCSMMLALTRDIPRACASLKTGAWERSLFMGNEVFGKTLAVVGLGRIGREVATRMQSFGMRTIGYDPIIPAHVAKEFGVESMPLEELWPEADYITVHVPLIPETKHLINDNVFACCRKGMRIINVARGGIIDEAALLRALKSGQCAGAALDVFDEEPPKDLELLQHPAVVCTPHLGASTHEAQTRVAVEIAEQFVDYAESRNLFGVVNAPTLAEALKSENSPWVELAGGLGKLARSVGSSVWQKDVEIGLTAHGEGFEKLLELLKTSVVVGILSEETKNGVNLINAPTLAVEHGIKINASSAPSGSSRALSVQITINDFTLQVSGTVNGASPALTLINSDVFPGTIPLNGRLLFFRNENGDTSMVDVINKLSSSSIGFNSVHCASPDKTWFAVAIDEDASDVESVNPTGDVLFSA